MQHRADMMASMSFLDRHAGSPRAFNWRACGHSRQHPWTLMIPPRDTQAVV